MENPFDQFDTAEPASNPFDQFDVGASSEPASKDYSLADHAGRIIETAADRSLSGMAYHGLKGEALDVNTPKDLSFTEGVLADILSFADPTTLVAFMAGGGVGGIALKSIATAAGKKALVSKLALAAAKKPVTFTTAEKMAIGAAGASGSLGAYGTASDAANQYGTTGDISVEHALKEGVKSAGLGLVSGGIGGRILAKEAKTISGKLAQHTGDIAAQAGIFTAGGALLDGQPMTWEGLAHNAAMFGGLKVAGHLKKSGVAKLQDRRIRNKSKKIIGRIDKLGRELTPEEQNYRDYHESVVTHGPESQQAKEQMLMILGDHAPDTSIDTTQANANIAAQNDVGSVLDGLSGQQAPVMPGEQDLSNELNQPNLGATSREEFLAKKQQLAQLQEQQQAEQEAQRAEAQRQAQEIVATHEQAVNEGYQPTEQETAEYEDARASLGGTQPQAQTPDTQDNYAVPADSPYLDGTISEEDVAVLADSGNKEAQNALMILRQAQNTDDRNKTSISSDQYGAAVVDHPTPSAQATQDGGVIFTGQMTDTIAQLSRSGIKNTVNGKKGTVKVSSRNAQDAMDALGVESFDGYIEPTKQPDKTENKPVTPEKAPSHPEESTKTAENKPVTPDSKAQEPVSGKQASPKFDGQPNLAGYAIDGKNKTIEYPDEATAQAVAPDNMVVVAHPKVDGAYALRTKAKVKPAKTPKPQRPSDNLIGRIRQKGGISLAQLRDITGESNVKNVGAVGVFKKGGRSAEDIAHEIGHEFGIDSNDVQGFKDKVREALGGTQIHSVEKAQRLEEKRIADAEKEQAKIDRINDKIESDKHTSFIETPDDDFFSAAAPITEDMVDEIFGATPDNVAGKKETASTQERDSNGTENSGSQENADMVRKRQDGGLSGEHLSLTEQKSKAGKEKKKATPQDNLFKLDKPEVPDTPIRGGNKPVEGGSLLDVAGRESAKKQTSIGDKPQDKPEKKEPWQMTQSEFEDGVRKNEADARDYAKDTLIGAVKNAISAIGRARLDKLRITEKGKSVEDWLQGIADRETTWKNGIKSGSTGIQMLSQKNLWTQDGEPLRKAALKYLQSRNKNFHKNQNEASESARRMMNAGNLHKKIVSEALSEGKPVPEAVLKDYPDLQKAEKAAQPTKVKAAQPEAKHDGGDNETLAKETISEYKLDGIKEGGIYEVKEQLSLPATQSAGVDSNKSATGRRSPRVSLRKIGSIKTGTTTVKTAHDAAHVVASLRKEAQEHFGVVVIDKDGEVLSIIQHSVGGVAQSQVFPGIISGAIASVKGAKGYYLVHNHPSGTAELSPQDLDVFRSIEDLTRAAGITGLDVLAVTHNGRFASIGKNNQLIHPMNSNKSIDVKVRRLTAPTMGKPLNNPAALRDAIKEIADGKTGVILADHKYNPTAFIEISMEDMNMMRGKDAARQYLAALHEGNASNQFVIIKGRLNQAIDPLDVNVVKNMQGLGNAARVVTQDAWDISTNRSLREAGLHDYKEKDQNFYSKGSPTTGQSVAQTKQSLIKQFGNAMKRALRDKRVVVVEDESELPVRPSNPAIDSSTSYIKGVGYTANRQTSIEKINNLIIRHLNLATSANTSNTVNSEPRLTDGSSEARVANTKAFRSVFSGDTFFNKRYDAIDVRHRRMMLSVMFRAGKHSKVLNSVVDLVPVDVVDMLAAKKLTPKMFFHDVAMFIDSLTINGNHSVSAAIDVADTMLEIMSSTGVRAKNLIANDLTRESLKGGRADVTSQGNGLGRLSNNLSARARAEKLTRSIFGDSKSTSLDFLATGSTFDNRHGKSSNDLSMLGERGVSSTATPHTNELPSSIQGLYEPVTDTTYIVANRVTERTIGGVLLHEALHSFFHINGKAYQNAATQLDRISKIAGKRGRVHEWLNAAESRAKDAGTPSSDMVHETMSYALENYEMAPSSIKKWVDKFIGEIRALLIRKFGLDMKINPATLRALARQHLKDMGRREFTGNYPMVGEPLRSTAAAIPETDTIPENKTLTEKVKDGFRELKDAVQSLPKQTDIKKIVGELTGEEQITDLKLTQYIKAFNKLVSKERQTAITHYIQSGGDIAKLKEQARQVDKKYRQGFEDAARLTDEDKAIAKSLQANMDADWAAANKAGIINDYVENYVTGIWKRKNKAARKMAAVVTSGILDSHPSAAKRKVFESYFEGIKAGYEPEDLRIGYLFASHRRSVYRAIAAKKALAELMHAKAEDGSPVVVVGGIGTVSKGSSAYLIKPNAAKVDHSIYKTINHPAMQKWKWVQNDIEGNPIIMEGPMYVHKDSYKYLHNLLGESKIRTYEVPDNIPLIHGTRPGDALLKIGGFIKGTILIGPFHQFHLAEHAVFHKTNPFNAPAINFDDPRQKKLVYNGLMVHSGNAIHEFAEGLASGGLLHIADRAVARGLKKAGVKYDPALQRYQEWLFGDYIPRLKMAMALHAVDRAHEYYAKDLKSGKMTEEQLYDNVANQSNAAFGEQNYKFMGRNKTFQDALRLGLLAPDFLESRFKFAGQALKKGGREQMTAFIRGAVIMSLTAQIVNMMFGDDGDDVTKDSTEEERIWSRVNMKAPFSVLIDGHDYSPRSVVGDMMHLLSDPRGFWYYRLNPVYGRSMLEVLTGKDQSGIKETPQAAAENILKSYIPIPAQGLIRKGGGETLALSTINTMLSSIGVSNWKHRTPFEKEVSNINFNHISIGGRSEKQKLRYKVYRDVMDKYEIGDINSIREARAFASKKGVVLSKQQMQRIRLSRDKTKQGRKQTMERRMRSFTADEMMGLWDKMDDAEKMTYRSFIRGKIYRSKTMTRAEKVDALKKTKKSIH